MPFGKYKNQELDTIPLLYLDWLIAQDWLYPNVKEEISVYLSLPVIQGELNKKLQEKEDLFDGR